MQIIPIVSRKEARELAKRHKTTFTKGYAIATAKLVLEQLNCEITRLKRNRDGTITITYNHIPVERMPIIL